MAQSRLERLWDRIADRYEPSGDDDCCGTSIEEDTDVEPEGDDACCGTPDGGIMEEQSNESESDSCCD